MRIDEFEFRNKKGEEVEPTKAQLVIYIKSLHKDIKDFEAKLAEKEKEIEKLNKLIEKQVDNAYKIIQNCKELQIEQLEKVKWWCQGNAIQCFYNEAETEIKEKHIVVDRPQENGSPSLIKYIDNQIKQLKERK